MRANKPLILGITGGVGSGKSEAARYLSTLGAVHVDADAISHALTAPGGEALPAIREAFGDRVFRAGPGSLVSVVGLRPGRGAGCALAGGG